MCEGAAVGEQSAAWSLPYYHAPCISLGSIYNGSCFEDYPFKLPGGGAKITSAYANATGEDDDLPDGMIALHAVATLKKLAAEPKKPFFIAVGFHKPHLPHIAPKKYFDLYPNVSLAANEYPPENLPKVAWNGCGEFNGYPDNKAAAKAADFGEHTPFVSALFCHSRWLRVPRPDYMTDN